MEESKKKKKRIFTRFFFIESVNLKRQKKRFFKVSVFMSVIYILIALLLLIFSSALLIKYTSFKKFVFWEEQENSYELYRLQCKLDSIEQDLYQKTLYLDNIRLILSGESFDQHIAAFNDSNVINYQNIKLKRSKADSLLRNQVESRLEEVYFSKSDSLIHQEEALFKDFLADRMLKPLSGIVVEPYDVRSHHYGIDIVADEEGIVKAVLQGKVIFADKTGDAGYVIILQHEKNLVSVYKNNAVLLKKTGDMVELGDSIAVVQETPENSSRVVSLRFELWQNGKPINPEKFITY